MQIKTTKGRYHFTLETPDRRISAFSEPIDFFEFEGKFLSQGDAIRIFGVDVKVTGKVILFSKSVMLVNLYLDTSLEPRLNDKMGEILHELRNHEYNIAEK
jgi:hypothetical protein